MGGAPLLGLPGLAVREGEVDVRLFRKREEAETASRAGVRRLAERVLERDLAWVRKELGSLLAKAGSGTAPGSKAPDFRATLDAWTAKPAAHKAASTTRSTPRNPPGSHAIGTSSRPR